MTDNSEFPLALPVGTELVGDYVITRTLGAGGFGITYEARERSLDRMVAIKEFFPLDIVERDGWALVKARSRDLDMKFARGLRRFIEEAKTITQFNHPNIVRVLRYFKTNNTAFMVLHYEQGIDFDLWQRQLKHRLTEDELKAIILPLLDALETIHASDFLHRDIAPDNIIIRQDGNPVLIDFGSARGELTFNEKTVSALVKSGYSPFEQYAKTSKEQGPWTDIYSFGATLYQAVTRISPADSLSRLANDELVPAAKLAKKHYSQTLLRAIDRAMVLKIAERPQTVAEWRDMLFPPSEQAEPIGGVLIVRTPKTGGPGPLQGLADKAADLSGNMARAAARAKENLRELMPAERPKSRPRPPAAGGAKKKRHRSLMSLLNEMDHRRTGKAHEKRIENMAKGVASPAEAQRELAPRVSKTRVARLMERLKALLAPLRRAAKPLILLLLVGGIAGGGWRYRENILDYTDDLDLDFNISLPEIKAPPPLFPEKPREQIARLATRDGAVGRLFMTEDGKQLISAGASSATLKLWDLRERKFERSITVQNRPVTALDRHNEVLLIADETGEVVLYDQRDNEQIVRFQAYAGAIKDVAFTGREFDFVVGGAGGELVFWDYKDGQFIQGRFRGRDHKGDITTIAANNSYVVTGSADNSARMWGRLRRRSLIRVFRSHKAPVRDVAIAPSARRIATASDDGTVRIWSNRSRRVRRVLRGHEGPVYSVAWSPDSKWVVSGGADKIVRMWNPRRARQIRSFEGHAGAIRAVMFSKDGQRLISAGDDGDIRVWDLAPKKQDAKVN